MDIIKKFEPIFGEWYVESLIGAGSFGRVYKIYREEFGERYYSALKYIPIPADDMETVNLRDDGLDDASITAYYTNLAKDLAAETRIMAHLKGLSNIVSYEFSKMVPRRDNFGYDVFIQMELLNSLSAKMRVSPLTVDEVVDLGLDISRALCTCHKIGVIHRDIKPDNIFINNFGDYKLGDFGIARNLEKTATFMSKKGTYNYMAPEVFKGDRYGAGCDIYSLGLVMYRLLNHSRLPFLPPAPQPITPAEKELALQNRLGGMAITPPCDADAELSAIILKACAYKPADRYSTAQEMYDALFAYKHANRAAVNTPIVNSPFDGIDSDKTAVMDNDKTMSVNPPIWTSEAPQYMPEEFQSEPSGAVHFPGEPVFDPDETPAAAPIELSENWTLRIDPADEGGSVKRVVLNNEDGYIELGSISDTAFGDAVQSSVLKWVALNGQIVPFYQMNEKAIGDRRIISGRTSANVNGDLSSIFIELRRSADSGFVGKVIGASPVSQNEDDASESIRQIRPGDELDFVCDFYSNDGVYSESMFFGEHMLIEAGANGQPVLKVTLEPLDHEHCIMY